MARKQARRQVRRAIAADDSTHASARTSTEQERAFADLKVAWENAEAFRHACAAAPVAVRDRFYAEVVRVYC